VRSRGWRCGAVIALFVGGISASGSGQAATEAALKAAFLYNFAKFTEWPAAALPAGARLALCATDEAVWKELAPMTAGRSIDGHLIETRLTGPDSETLRSCHMLYVSDVDATRAAQILGRLKGAPVFTVGDLDGFVRLGGVARFFVERGRMRFDIGVESSQRASLRVSSKLLSLAKVSQGS
jgi:hypothetical protein